MAADLEQLYAALRAADAAGDTAAAQRLASYIQSLGTGAREKAEADTEAWQKTVKPESSGLQNFVAGYGKAGSDLAKGAGKLVRDVMEAVTPNDDRKLSDLIVPKKPTSPGSRAADAIGLPNAQDLADSDRLDRALIETGAGKAGNIVGNIAAAVPSAFVPGANTVLGAGAIGAGYGAIAPAADWMERAKNVGLGAVLSGGITGAVKAAPALWKAFVSPFTAKGQEDIALSTIGRFAKDPAAVTKAVTDELIPGSRPSLAEVTGDPGIAQLQRAAQAKSPEVASAFSDVLESRVKARKAALFDIAGADGKKEFFEAARDATAQRLYGEAFKAKVDPKVAKAVAPEVAELLKRPSIQAAQSDAVRIAKEEGVDLTPAKMKAGSIESLHYMKKSLDGMISKANTSGDKAEASRLLDTQDKLLGVMDELSPAYKNARAEYAAASKPINQMQIGEYLTNKLFPAMTQIESDGMKFSSRQKPDRFLEAVKAGDKMARDATGFKGAKLADILTTDQLNTVINLAKDVARESGTAERAAVRGSPTAQYLSGANMLRQIAGPLGLPESWVEKTVGQTLSSWSSKFPFNIAEESIQSKLGDMLTNPEAAKAAAARQAQSFAAKNPRLAAVPRYTVPPLSVSAMPLSQLMSGTATDR